MPLGTFRSKCSAWLTALCCRVEEVAKKMNITMAQVAIAWSLAKDEVTAPIVGTTSLENLKDLIGKGIDFSNVYL